MFAAPVMEASEQTADDVVQRLRETLDWLGSLTGDPDSHSPEPVSDAQRIDRLAVLERLQGSLEAVKAVEIVAFAHSQAAEQVALGVHPTKVGRGIADQITVAGRVSPTEGSRRRNTARDLVLDMPHTLGLLSPGRHPPRHRPTDHRAAVPPGPGPPAPGWTAPWPGMTCPAEPHPNHRELSTQCTRRSGP